MIVLLNVDPIVADGDGAAYRECNWCYESACTDIWAGHLQEEAWRQFFQVAESGLTICSVCLAAGKLEEDA